MYKVETNKLLAPMKMYIKYRKQATSVKNISLPERARSGKKADEK